jgi:hypothetical protein
MEYPNIAADPLHGRQNERTFVTHFMPTALLPAVYSTTLSTSAKGYRCGKILSICSDVKTVLRDLVNDEISCPLVSADALATSALATGVTKAIAGAAVSNTAAEINKRQFMVEVSRCGSGGGGGGDDDK